MAAPAAKTDETDLVRDAQSGDRQAFAGLVERHWDGLYRWLYHLTHDRDAAEDLAQESFLRALAGLATFRAGTNFRAWLFRIGYNQWANQRRERRKVPLPFPEELPAHDDTPADLAMSREALGRLADAVGALPRDYRAAFLLRADEGLSFREIAGVLEITEETARWRVCKARQKLLDVMKPHLE